MYVFFHKTYRKHEKHIYVYYSENAPKTHLYTFLYGIHIYTCLFIENIENMFIIKNSKDTFIHQKLRKHNK